MTTRTHPGDADLRVEDDGGSVVLIRPLTREACQWIEECTEGEATVFGSAVACERRFVQPIIDGAEADGLNVEVTQ